MNKTLFIRSEKNGTGSVLLVSDETFPYIDPVPRTPYLTQVGLIRRICLLSFSAVNRPEMSHLFGERTT